MSDLTLLIASRNEMFLNRTIQDILEHSGVEVIVVLDGPPTEPPIVHARVSVVYHPEPIGQRAAINEAAKLSRTKYVMKVDAHCSFDQDFDIKLLADMQDDWTLVPVMRNLIAFNWVCQNGHSRDQGPSGVCEHCGEPTERKMIWTPRPGTRTSAYYFDTTPHFDYFDEFMNRPGSRGDLTETMSLQGSAFLMTREKFFELNVCDEAFGSWGSQGIEVACKTWLSGGRVMVSHKTWYAHLFRTQGGDFGFPYKQSGKQVKKAKRRAKELFFGGTWEKQTRPLSWLVDKFWPIPDWTIEDRMALEKKPTVGIVYYTDSRIPDSLAIPVREQIKRSVNGHEIISVSLKPLEFGRNISLDLEPGYLAMFSQILAGLEASTADIIFFCEHDVLYHPSHFKFLPPDKNTYYYNENVFKVDLSSGKALHYDCQQTSGLCAYRELLLEHYRKRVALVQENGFSKNMGFEPGTHNRKERVDDYKAESWESEYPNIDIRHSQNLTPSRWRKDQFRNQRYTEGWTEVDEVTGWGKPVDFLKEIMQ